MLSVTLQQLLEGELLVVGRSLRIGNVKLSDRFNQFVEVRNQALIYLNSAVLRLLFKKCANSIRVMYSLYEELLMIIDSV